MIRSMPHVVTREETLYRRIPTHGVMIHPGGTVLDYLTDEQMLSIAQTVELSYPRYYHSGASNVRKFLIYRKTKKSTLKSKERERRSSD